VIKNCIEVGNSIGDYGEIVEISKVLAEKHPQNKEI